MSSTTVPCTYPVNIETDRQILKRTENITAANLVEAMIIIMKKALRETQTLRAGCSKAEPKIFAPPQTPFQGARDGQNLISWRWSLPLPPTNPVW